MLKSIGIAAFGGAIGIPVWGVAAIGIGILGAGVGIGVLGKSALVALAVAL